MACCPTKPVAHIEFGTAPNGNGGVLNMTEWNDNCPPQERFVNWMFYHITEQGESLLYETGMVALNQFIPQIGDESVGDALAFDGSVNNEGFISDLETLGACFCEGDKIGIRIVVRNCHGEEDTSNTLEVEVCRATASWRTTTALPWLTVAGGNWLLINQET